MMPIAIEITIYLDRYFDIGNSRAGIVLTGVAMSATDEVLCNHPFFGENRGEVHQTLSLEPAFPGAKYEITAWGRLELLVCTYEDRSDPNAEGLTRLAGSLTPVFNGERHGLNYHGWLALPGFGRAKFTDGSLVGFEPETSRPGDVAANEKELTTLESVVWTSALSGRYTAIAVCTGSLDRMWNTFTVGNRSRSNSSANLDCRRLEKRSAILGPWGPNAVSLIESRRT